MAASIQVESALGADRPRGESGAAALLSEFILTRAHPIRQRALLNDNPFCTLAARTAVGTRVCGHGCGLVAPGGAEEHVCPFGLIMRRAEEAGEDGADWWLGRRFPTVRAMHHGLDQLIAEGISEEKILSHLPPNPITTWEELRAAKRQTSALPAPGGSAPAAGEEFGLSDLLEYLEQVHSLLATAHRPETICERFLRAIAAAVPFDEMAIYLRATDGSQDWVIAASVDVGPSAPAEPRAQPCRLAPDSLGWQAAEQRRIMAERAGQADLLQGEFEGPGSLAIPLPVGGGTVLGVWLAHQSAQVELSPMGGDAARFMRLLAELLAARLQQVEMARRQMAIVRDMAQPATAGETLWGRTDLQEALGPEAARTRRRGHSLALVCLRAHGSAALDALPEEELTRQFAASLRPYDQMGRWSEARATWVAILPEVGEAEARAVAERLLSVFEDTMDAQGGMEELGLSCRVGIALGGRHEGSARQMIELALGAAEQPPKAEDDIILVSQEQEIAVGM